MIRINITDLVINLLIELNIINGTRKINSVDLDIYEQEIIKTCCEKNIELLMINGINQYNDFISNSRKHIAFFDDIQNTEYIMIPGISSSDLIDRFRGSIPLDALLILVDKDIIQTVVSKKDSEKLLTNNEIELRLKKESLIVINKCQKEIDEEYRKIYDMKRYCSHDIKLYYGEEIGYSCLLCGEDDIIKLGNIYNTNINHKLFCDIVSEIIYKNSNITIKELYEEYINQANILPENHYQSKIKAYID